ncbi:hypothetical protein QYE76_000144 [Lolium multiflorum]|uniref:Transposase (putative) gypsy type domain-containing protein n=1 Tax=Lolium multiflorum TaxID=4521 RepID=A0AAD8RIP7_LOLMU|nr:hypothetical protein QYE76_000144 [Lolium multiflorum]
MFLNPTAGSKPEEAMLVDSMEVDVPVFLVREAPTWVEPIKEFLINGTCRLTKMSQEGSRGGPRPIPSSTERYTKEVLPVSSKVWNRKREKRCWWKFTKENVGIMPHQGRWWQKCSGTDSTGPLHWKMLRICHHSKTPTASSGEEVSVDRVSDGLETELAQSEAGTGSSTQATGNQGETGSSSQGTGIDLNSYTRGAWMGSDVTQAKIDWLYRSRRMPEEVWCRIPGEERRPEPQPGERVVFSAHFERGLGLPASDFFRSFLDFYELQPHHLPGNSIFFLSSFATFMEGYVGMTPSVDNFSFFYYLRKNSIQDKNLPPPKPLVRCGGCILSPRQGSPFFKLSGLESVRTWQKSFFYVRNGGPEDFINLPEYVPGPPSTKNWLHNPKDDKESIRIGLFVQKNKEETNLSADDLVMTFLSHRVLPLQRRAHKICQMRGRMDPARITTHQLSASDLVLKAKQICQNSLRPSGKYGLAPYSRSNSPPRQNFRRIRQEEQASYAPNRRFQDDCDPDPYLKGKHTMGPTYTKHPGLRPAGANPEVVEHAVPVSAEVGQEFLDNLASRGRKKKAPAPEAGTSDAPPAKRSRKEVVGGKQVTAKHYRKREMPVASGPALKISKSATGMRPEGSEDAARASPPPQPSPVPSGAGKSPASSRGGNTSAGRAAPETSHHRAEEDFFSPPEAEDTGASNIGAGSEDTGRAEPLVPPVPKKKATASPSKTVPETSAPATSPPAKEVPEASAPTKDAPPSPPAASTGKSAAADPARPEGTKLTAQQLAVVVTAATSPSSGSQSLPGPAAGYAEKVEPGGLVSGDPRLGKDKLPVVDPSGPRSTAQHLSRLKRAVKEFDTAWHDASGNVVGTLDTRKQLFEELLWEHRFLSEAHSKCQALPEVSFEDLSAQLSTLKAEKEQLVVEHRKALDAQEKISAELKDELMQAELRHAHELKDAHAAAEAKLDESLKEFTNSSAVLRAELEEESRARKEAQDRIATLTTDQAEYDRLVIQADTLALQLFPDSQPFAQKRVTERRVEQALSNPDAPWDPYDHLVALAARISHMRAVDRHLVELPERAIQIFKVLWPGEAVPANLTLLSDRLRDAGRRFREWKCSAARAGADAALRIACSWYEDLDLDAFHSLRGDAPTDKDPVLTAKRQDRAYRIAEFAPTHTFIPPPPGVRDEISDDEEEDVEDKEDEESAEGDAPPEQGDAPPEAPEAGAQPPVA